MIFDDPLARIAMRLEAVSLLAKRRVAQERRQAEGAPEHRAFGPQVIEIACFLAPEIGHVDTVSLFEEVDRRWPELSFRDFLGAAVLAEALAMKTEGSA